MPFSALPADFNICPGKNARKGRKCKKYPIFCKKYPTPQPIVIAIFATEPKAISTPCGLKSETTKKIITTNILLTISPEEKITQRGTKPIIYEK